MGGRPVKQCSNIFDHRPHDYVDGNGSASVYTLCDGLTQAALAEQGLIFIEPLTDLARLFLSEMATSAKVQIVKAALRAGVRIDDRFECEVTETQVAGNIDLDSIIVRQSQTGHVRLAYSNSRAEGSGEGGISPAALPTVLRVKPGSQTVVDTRSRDQIVIEVEGRIKGEVWQDDVPLGSDLWHMLNELLPEIDAHMRLGAAHYGHDTHRDLGLRGQYADMYRKWAILKRVMWDGETTAREPLREVLMDMIGHSLLTICMLDKGEGQVKE